MLEISSTDKGILLPGIALKSTNDTMSINQNPTDGLLIFNTTENPQLNLYKGLYAWNSVKGAWANLVSHRNFPNILTSHYAVEETFLVINIRTPQEALQQTLKNNLSQVTFETCIINRDNCFHTATGQFIVPEKALYKIVCGIEVYCTKADASDYAGMNLVFTKPSGQTVKESASLTRAYIMPDKTLKDSNLVLAPSLIYSDSLEAGTKVSMEALFFSSKTSEGKIRRKYLYIDAL
jgi:hypothetical protein